MVLVIRLLATRLFECFHAAALLVADKLCHERACRRLVSLCMGLFTCHGIKKGKEVQVYNDTL